MTLADDVYDVLVTVPTVAGRVYRRRLPQPYTLPAQTFFRVNTVFEYAHDGDSTLIHPRFQVSCWAETNAAAESLARKVQQAMDGWAGGVALPVGQYDITDPDTDMWQVPIDFILWYNVT